MSHEKSQLNFWYIPFHGDHAWINYLKGAQVWTRTDGFALDPTLLNTDGYPNGASSEAIQTQIQVETLAQYSGNWVLKWTGTVAAAGFSFSSGGYVNVSGSLTNNTTRRCVFQLTSADASPRLAIFNIPAASTLTNIAIMREDEETRYDAGEIFGAKFLSVLQSGDFGKLRFLDWLNVNFSMETTWATRKPLNYITYGGCEMRANIYAGDLTLSANKNYTCSAPSSWPGLVDKAMVSFHPKNTTVGQLVTALSSGTSGKVRLTVASSTGFTTGDSVSVAYFGGSGAPNLNYICTVIDATHIDLNGTTWDAGMSADPSRSSVVLRYTLAVGGTTAKFVNLPGGNPIYDLGHRFVNGYIGQAVYDASLDCWCAFGGSGPAGGHVGLSNGVPPEIMVALCNKVNMAPWFNIPHLAMDPQTDYASSLATLCQSTLNPGLVPVFECGNEVWNTGFAATSYAISKGVALWSIPLAYGNPHEWYGKVVSTIGQTISSVYGADRTKYRMVCAWQTRNAFTFEFASRLTSDKYVTVNGGSAASNWATHCALANYFSSSYTDTAQETTWASEWLAGNSTVKAARIASYLAGCSSTVGGGGFPLPSAKERITTFVAAYPAYNGKVLFYEGGYSPDYVGNSQTVYDFRAATKASSLMVDILAAQYADMLDAGGQSPSMYMFSGAAQAWSVWDPDVYVTPEPPQWTAAKAFNAAAVDPVGSTTTRARPRIRLR